MSTERLKDKSFNFIYLRYGYVVQGTSTPVLRPVAISRSPRRRVMEGEVLFRLTSEDAGEEKE